MATKKRRKTGKRRPARRTRATGTRSSRRRRRGRTVKKVSHQVGSTTPDVDRRYEALPPGKRISANGKVYWETRKNRSDLRGRI